MPRTIGGENREKELESHGCQTVSISVPHCCVLA